MQNNTTKTMKKNNVKKSKGPWLYYGKDIYIGVMSAVLLLALILWILGDFVSFDKYKQIYLIILVIDIAFIFFVVIERSFIRLITKWLVGGDSRCKEIWNGVIFKLSEEYQLNIPENYGRDFEMKPFSGKIVLNKAYLYWNQDLIWEFPANYKPTYYEIKTIISDITYIQAIHSGRNPIIDESERRELIINRVFAYEYEDMIYELLSKGRVYYDTIEGWRANYSCPIPYDVFRVALEEKFSINSEEATTIIAELIRRNIITDYTWEGYEKGIRLGDILGVYWCIVSKEDMNLNKYCLLHNVPRTSNS